MGHDGVFVHIAEKWYLPKATWSDSTFRENLRKELAKLKPNLIGNVAPNLMLIQIPSDHFRIAYDIYSNTLTVTSKKKKKKKKNSVIAESPKGVVTDKLGLIWMELKLAYGADAKHIQSEPFTVENNTKSYRTFSRHT